jgi:zinc protease
MRERGPFTINFSTRADQANEAIKLSQAILGDFVEKGPTDQELGEAKAAIVGSFPLATASNASISGYLGMIGFYGLPLDYLDQYLLHIQKVSKEDVKRAFQRHINPKKQLIVTVGKSLP